jgi:dolichol-phosphate mannosyltransferase
MDNIGIVIPSYNEHEGIVGLIQEIRRYVPQSQIVVVDDSKDERTVVALRPLLDRKTHLIRRTFKGGRGTAVIEGIRKQLELGCETILEMDADMSHPPSQLPELIKKVSVEKLDLLIASRYLPSSKIKNWPLSRRIFSKCSNWLAHFVLQVPVSDYTNGYRCYSKRASIIISEHCGRLGSGFIALSEILVTLYYRGLKTGEVPTIFTNRIRGESSLNANEIWNAARGLIRIYRLKAELKRGQYDRVSESAYSRME